MFTHRVAEGQGQHVTLIHGVGAALDSWDGVQNGLRKSYRVLRYDLRGHGESDKTPGPYGLDDFVDDLKGLLDDEEAPTTNLVGFSFGGTIAQAFALRYPERITKFVLISGIAGRTDEERTRILERTKSLEQGGVESTIDAAIERWFTVEFRQQNRDLIQERIRRAKQNDPKAYAAAYRVFAQSDLVDSISEIQAPTLIITGEHDVGSTPRMAKLMHQRIKNSKLCILPRLRHGLLSEAPDELAALIDGFLSNPE
ncbi:MAG: alpha/beta fold hydrolase [Gammaproteobacteria bacterium]|nr:alpha/beta fold hydrolase [Gammaproteobacteria bacterium]